MRLPGERGLALHRKQLSEGIALYAGILDALAPWASKLKVTPPSAL